MIKNKFGLQPLPKDPRDLKLGAILTLPPLSELPEKFLLEPPDLKTQLDDFCSGNTVALLIGTNEGEAMDENWSFAKSKELSGDYEEWGQNMRTAMSVGVKFGGLPKKLSPHESDKGSTFLRNPANWSKELEWAAKPYKQQTYFTVRGQYDAFDDIRASIWAMKKRGQRQGAGIGVEWAWNLSAYLLDTIGNGYGHMMAVIGWEGNHLVVQNSYGLGAGKKGRHLIGREVVNHFAEKYGAMMFVDIPKEKARYLTEHGIKLDDNWLVALWKVIKSFWPDLTFGAGRDPRWRDFRNAYIREHPLCELCGVKAKTVHHIIPVSVDKSKELDPDNFFSACKKCHLYFCHLGFYRSYNKDIKKDALLWEKKRKNRP